LKQADKLAEPIFTPTTKAPKGQHDEAIDDAEGIRLVGADLYNACKAKSLELYRFGHDRAAAAGMILADTKFEFGTDVDGGLWLIDEVLTPDSSRYWPADSYAPGGSPPSYDKQFVRDHLLAIKWDQKPPAPRLPDDVILNTRRAYSVSNTTLNGYSESLGAPEGRYIAPANSGSCLQVRAGDCAQRALLIRAPWFTRVDLGVTKQFPIAGRTNFELRIDILNLFDNVNFDPVANPGTGATIFQATTAYTDASNTYDPGGRLGQIAFRINW